MMETIENIRQEQSGKAQEKTDQASMDVGTLTKKQWTFKSTTP